MESKTRYFKIILSYTIIMPFFHNLEEDSFAMKKDPKIVPWKMKKRGKNRKKTFGEVIATQPLLLSTNWGAIDHFGCKKLDSEVKLSSYFLILLLFFFILWSLNGLKDLWSNFNWYFTMKLTFLSIAKFYVKLSHTIDIWSYVPQLLSNFQTKCTILKSRLNLRPKFSLEAATGIWIILWNCNFGSLCTTFNLNDLFIWRGCKRGCYGDYHD